MTDPNEHLKPPPVSADEDCSGTPTKSVQAKQSRRNEDASQGHSNRKSHGNHRHVNRKDSQHVKTEKANKPAKDRDESRESGLKGVQLDKQRKITHYFCNRPRPPIHHEIPSKDTQEDSLLSRKKMQISAKQAEIDTLTVQRLDLEQIYSRDEAKFDTYRKKAQSMLIQTLSEIYFHKRRNRLRPNPQVGFPRTSSAADFIEGPQFTAARERLGELTKKQKELHDNLSKKLQASERESLQLRLTLILIDQRQAENKIKQLEEQKRQIISRMKLYSQEANCKLAKEGWPVIGDRYLSLELLGRGGFSEVYRAYDLKENTERAIKISDLSACVSYRRQEYMKHVTREYNIQKTLLHPNIARLYDVILENEEQVITVLQLCKGPELSEYMKKQDKIEQKEAKCIIRQVLNALKYLDQRSEKIIHYDLKPQNLMFQDGLIKVLDFGLCKVVDTNQTKIQLTSQGTGTYWYLPPQTFDDSETPKISNKVDVWSVGAIYYEMLFGKKPFGHGMSQTRIIAEGIMMGATRVEFPSNANASDGAKQFIRGCLEYYQDKRLSVSEANNHPYFNQK